MSDNEIRLSQMIMGFGPGAMIDLPSRSIIVGGLPLWRQQIEPRIIIEPRLQEMLERSLTQSGRLPAGVRLTLRQPPYATNDGDRMKRDVPALVFPLWFVCDPESGTTPSAGGSRRRMVQWKEMEWSSGKFKDGTKTISVTPMRFVAACKKGHMQDINWRGLVHRGQGQAGCRSAMWFLDRGTSADPKDLSIECDCGARVEFEYLFAEGILGGCNGHQPWLGDQSVDANGCNENLKLLVRGATNAYFPQVANVIALPIDADHIGDIIKANLASLAKLTSVDQLIGVLSFNQALSSMFGAVDPVQIFSRIQDLKGAASPATPVASSPKVAEFDILASGKELIGINSIDSRLHAKTLKDDEWKSGDILERLLSRVVAVKRLTEVTCLYGFTRLEPAPVASDGSLEEVLLAVEGASLGEADWLPAIEQNGEGIFLQFDPAVVSAIMLSKFNSDRVNELRLAYQDWAGKFKNSPTFPGGSYTFLHSLSHALMSEIALQCGYPATSIKERVYALPNDSTQGVIGRLGILLYTSASGAQGSLGGLVAMAPKIIALLAAAIEKMQVCSNDPICSESTPQAHFDGSLVNGAACNACLLVPETSCEMRNMLLDRLMLSDLHAALA
ncbi:DUF1998 domain-containing protein [Tabrizicola sp. WMC-M-20]|nr:DUF1998 domain-containing protein [Tabrizicola sp. WMC-M-20]